jgi:hypothetical protein
MKGIKTTTERLASFIRNTAVPATLRTPTDENATASIAFSPVRNQARMPARLPTTMLRPANAGPIHVGQTMMSATWGLPNFASLFAFPMINGHQAVCGTWGPRRSRSRTGRGWGGRGSSQAPRPRKARVCVSCRDSNNILRVANAAKCPGHRRRSECPWHGTMHEGSIELV